MLLAKVVNGAITEIADYKTFFNAVPSDEELIASGLVRVNQFRPHDRLTEKLVTCDAVLEGGWAYVVAVEPMTAEEIDAHKQSALANIRAQRNFLLSSSDWTQLEDSPVSNKSEWATYRQVLRDLPSTIQDARIWNDWPLNPDAEIV